MNSNLLEDIRAYMKARKIKAHRFGMLAANNGRLVERLESGGRVWPETEAKIRAFLKNHSHDQPNQQA